jgi:2-dehydro-3-deoxygluconokinase
VIEKKVAGKVVGLGELLLRLSPAGKKLIVQSQSLDIEVGGAEANVIASLAALGRETAMISTVAANPLGELVTSTLRARGVSADYIVKLPGRMGLYFYESGQGLRASSVTYDRADSTFVKVGMSSFDFDSILSGADLLHLSGITPALGPSSSALALHAAKRAKEIGVPVSFDCNYREQLWSAWDSDPKSILFELISNVDILFGNHRDIALLTGGSFSGDGPERRREAVNAAFSAFPDLKLIASTSRHVIDSDHHNISARVDQRDDHAQTKEIAVTGIIDRIGTGDAFAAGVLHEWLKGNSCLAMAESGLSLGVLKHSLPGDMSLFNESDIAAFWSENRDVRR